MQKKAAFYLKSEVIKKLEDYCEETGLSKAVAVEGFITRCIDEYEETKRKSKLLKKPISL